MDVRTDAVTGKVTRIKILHIILSFVWPVVTAGLFFLAFYLRGDLGVLTIFTMLLVFLWGSYSYYILLGMRNDDLRMLAVEFCDFGAYLECMQFVGRFNINSRAALGQSVNCVDAYLMKGDFDGAYRLLTALRSERDRMNTWTRLTYDFCWCKLYADLEDTYRFEQALAYFRQTWLGGQNAVNDSSVRGSLMRVNASMLDQELRFREMILKGQMVGAKEFLGKVWKSGGLKTRYEFVKYCYYMGRIEFGEANFPTAKHWFAQTVSFGLREHMSDYASQFLEKLDMAGVPYAEKAPAGNERRQMGMEHTHYPSAFASMFLGLFAIIMLLLMR